MSKKAIYLLFVNQKLVNVFYTRENAFKTGLAHDREFKLQRHILSVPEEHDGLVYVATCSDMSMFGIFERVLGVFTDHDKAYMSFDPFEYEDFDISIFEIL